MSRTRRRTFFCILSTLLEAILFAVTFVALTQWMEDGRISKDKSLYFHRNDANAVRAITFEGHDYLLFGPQQIGLGHSASCPCTTNQTSVTHRVIFER